MKASANVVHISTPVTAGDLDAAFQFVTKRVKRHGADPLDGMSAALYSVMFMVGDALVECGLPADEVARIFDQTKAQVVFQLASRAKAGAA